MSTIDVERVKQRHPVAGVIAASGVALRRSGGHLSGPCPFHEDRSPSLHVYPQTRSFYCFGCGAGGDVIDYLRRLEGFGFREALEWLDGRPEVAAKAPARSAMKPPRRLSLDDRLILTAACELYHETLLRTPTALAYLDSRGVPPWLVRDTRLGYSDGRQLIPYLRRRRLSLRRARELGLVFRSDDETLAGRVVIPELRAGHCAWLVGRALDGRQPKYRGLSLPRPLLGYERIRGHEQVFLTEGPFDWLTLIGWGLPASALLGTQPGRDTLGLLERIPQVVLALDADQAGREAARQLAAALGERARVLDLPPGIKDVNELGCEPGGREAFLRPLESTSPVGRRRHDVATTA